MEEQAMLSQSPASLTATRPLDTRITNVLARNGIRTLAELCRQPTDKLLSFQMFGINTVDELDMALDNAGLRRRPHYSIDFLGLPPDMVRFFRLDQVTTITFLKERLDEGRYDNMSNASRELLMEQIARYDATGYEEMLDQHFGQPEQA